MRIGEAVNSLLLVGFVAGCIYLLLNWQSPGSQPDENGALAEAACIENARARFDASSVRAYRNEPGGGGFVVRMSVSLPNGKAIKVTCLSNEHGNVRELVIEER